MYSYPTRTKDFTRGHTYPATGGIAPFSPKAHLSWPFGLDRVAARLLWHDNLPVKSIWAHIPADLAAATTTESHTTRMAHRGYNCGGFGILESYESMMKVHGNRGSYLAMPMSGMNLNAPVTSSNMSHYGERSRNMGGEDKAHSLLCVVIDVLSARV
ncbi:hypothetical protein BDQ17DRAFT_1334789 [Cyathus striatus]|nr:hypothetical protein BDQ17DRAFT_1334789 [Cyathus striatus]